LKELTKLAVLTERESPIDLDLFIREIGQDVIDRAVGQFRKRLSLVVATGGGHIEHRFD